MYRVVIFDLDGTLVDSFEIGLETCLQTAASLKLPITKEIISSPARNWGRQTEDLIKACWPHADYKPFREAFNREHATKTPKLFEGIEDTLALLREKNVSLGIFTSRKIDSTLAILGRTGIRPYFDYIRTQSHFPENQKKPHPAGILSIVRPLAKVGIGPNDVLYVGDGVEADFPCAKNAGIEFVAITESKNVVPEEFLRSGLSGERILESVRSLPHFLS